mmetsp:Transcript_43124/g.69677  ORF Transcript_43124/g.69677 Transcript_43124/m.69677 type:complete len:191 (+) Transcript_43124:73-645(+)
MGKRWRPPPTAAPKERMDKTASEFVAECKAKDQEKSKGSKTLADWENIHDDPDSTGAIKVANESGPAAGPAAPKKEKKKDKAAKRAVSLHPRAPSPSHYAAPSETPFNGRTDPSAAQDRAPSEAPSAVSEAPPPDKKKKKDREKKEKKKGKTKGQEKEAALRVRSESAEPRKEVKRRGRRSPSPNTRRRR